MSHHSVTIAVRNHLDNLDEYIANVLRKKDPAGKIVVSISKCSMPIEKWKALLYNIPDLRSWGDLRMTKASGITDSTFLSLIYERRLRHDEDLGIEVLLIDGPSMTKVSFRSVVSAFAQTPLRTIILQDFCFATKDVAYLTVAIETGAMEINNLYFVRCSFPEPDVMTLFYKMIVKMKTRIRIESRLCRFRKQTFSMFAQAFKDSRVSHELDLKLGSEMPLDKAWQAIFDVLTHTKLAEFRLLATRTIDEPLISELGHCLRTAVHLERFHLFTRNNGGGPPLIKKLFRAIAFPPRALKNVILPWSAPMGKDERGLCTLARCFFYILYGCLRCPQSPLSLLKVDILRQLSAYLL